MKLALFSDLHLEFMRDQLWQPPKIDVDVVVLAGDIGKHTHGIQWAGTAFRQAKGSPKVVYVAGNHEYYGARLGMLSDLHKAGRKHDVAFLECATLELPGLRILGSTLWSGFSLYGQDQIDMAMFHARRSINDYLEIRTTIGERLEPRDTAHLHHRAVAWLDRALAMPFDGKTVVVTHFAPHHGCVAPQHQNSAVSPYFVTDLAWLMAKHRIDVWCHGHTHTNNNFIAENGCRVVSNQRGYPIEVTGSGFRPDLVVEV